MADKDGVFNLEELKQYVPEGYTFTLTGEESVKTPQIVIELTKTAEEPQPEELTEQIAHVQFVFEGEMVAGGDYFVMADKDGVFNLEELKQYVPEGYTFTLTGEESVKTPQIVIELTKTAEEPQPEELTEQIAHVQFVFEGEMVAGGDYFVMADKDGVFNLEELKQYVPEGYTFTLTGEESVKTPQIVIELTKTGEEPQPEENAEAKIKVQFVDEEGKVQGEVTIVKTGKEGENATFTAADLANQLPEGFELVDTDWTATVAYGQDGGNVTVTVKATEVPTPTPQQLTSTVTIHFVEADQVKASQVISRTGNEGETFVVTKADVDATLVPDGYQILEDGYFADTEVVYGQNVTLEIKLALKNTDGDDSKDDNNNSSSNNGSSSSGRGGSSSGSSSIVGNASKVLINGSWQLNDTGWWYSYSNGTYAKSGWYVLEWQNRLDWYFFDDNGYLVSGWFDQNGNRYYLHDVHDGTFGKMYTGWNKINNQWYFFNDNTTEGVYGALIADAVVPEGLK
ncbi:MAG: hypothetical protein Q4D90_05320 [bacterium]|nr:hypothetical protein [bacterium]